MRAVLVTDQPLLAEGLNALLERSGKFQLVAVYSRTADLLKMLPALGPELAIIDVGPDLFLPFLAPIVTAAPACKIVLLCRIATAEMTFHAQEIRALALLPTTLPVDQLLSCLERIVNGERIFDYSSRTPGATAKTIQLTKRESQLVALVSQGLKNKEIAAYLGISAGTVKIYFSRLFQKVGANDRLELALFGLKNASELAEIERAGKGGEATFGPPSSKLNTPVHAPRRVAVKSSSTLRIAQG